jgi:hypothetical protein
MVDLSRWTSNKYFILIKGETRLSTARALDKLRQAGLSAGNSRRVGQLCVNMWWLNRDG